MRGPCMGPSVVEVNEVDQKQERVRYGILYTVHLKLELLSRKVGTPPFLVGFHHKRLETAICRGDLSHGAVRCLVGLIVNVRSEPAEACEDIPTELDRFLADPAGKYQSVNPLALGIGLRVEFENVLRNVTHQPVEIYVVG